MLANSGDPDQTPYYGNFPKHDGFFITIGLTSVQTKACSLRNLSKF